MRLTKQDILNSRPLPTEEVLVPEWAPADWPAAQAATATVTVRAMTGRQRDAFEASLVAGEGKKRKPDLINVRAKLVGLCMVDEAGRRTHTDAEVASLGDTSAAALDRVFTVCQRLSGLSAEDVDTLEGKSAPDLNGSSSLNSASNLDSPTPTNSSTDSAPGN